MAFRVSIDDVVILENCIESVSCIANPPSDNIFTKGSKCRNKMTIKGRIGAGEQTIDLYRWALIDSNSSGAYKKVVVEEINEDKLIRKVCFKKAFVVGYTEFFAIYDGYGNFLIELNEFIGSDIECSSATDVPSKTKSVDESISEEETFLQEQKSVPENTQKRNIKHPAIFNGSDGTSNLNGERYLNVPYSKASRGLRNTEIFTEAQHTQVYKHIEELGLNPDDFIISSHVSCYFDMIDKALLGPDVFPASTRTTRYVLETITPRAAIAHEAGHMITTRAGTAF